MRTALRVSLLSLGLCGCVMFSAPPNNAPFASIQNVHSLEGTYRNVGETGKNGSAVLLSAVIWPTAEVAHKDISEVEVRALDNTTIQVTGRNDRGIIKQSQFVEGKDFEIADGRIKIKHNGGIAGFASGDPILGPYYENAELGLDAQGQGKYQSHSGVAGLVYLFLPMATVSDEEVRFVRISHP